LDFCIEPLSLAVIDGETEVSLYMFHTNLEIRIGYVGDEMTTFGAICNTLCVVRTSICRLVAFVIQCKEKIEVCFSLKNGYMA
jgi:hypothetical protein